MADYAGLLMNIYDQNCKILKRVAKIEKHLFLQSKELTKDIKIENSLIKLDEPRKNLKTNTFSGSKRLNTKNSKFNLYKMDEDFNSERFEEKIYYKDVTYEKSMNWLLQIVPDNLFGEDQDLYIDLSYSLMTDKYLEILYNCFTDKNYVNQYDFAYYFLNYLDSNYREILGNLYGKDYSKNLKNNSQRTKNWKEI